MVIGGLTPGKNYPLEPGRISRAFTGGSSIEPCDPPQSGFEEAVVPGTFSCSSGGEVVTIGTEASTRIITTKGETESTAPSDDSSGGCSLIPEGSLARPVSKERLAQLGDDS